MKRVVLKGVIILAGGRGIDEMLSTKRVCVGYVEREVISRKGSVERGKDRRMGREGRKLRNMMWKIAEVQQETEREREREREREGERGICCCHHNSKVVMQSQ